MAKRDPDLIRDILMWVEETVAPDCARQLEADLRYKTSIWFDQGVEFSHWHYQVELLADAEFLTAMINKTSVTISGITYIGHDYLDSVRDPDVWKATKDVAVKSGAWSLELLSDIAEGLIKTKIEKHTGMEV